MSDNRFKVSISGGLPAARVVRYSFLYSHFCDTCVSSRCKYRNSCIHFNAEEVGFKPTRPISESTAFQEQRDRSLCHSSNDADRSHSPVRQYDPTCQRAMLSTRMCMRPHFVHTPAHHVKEKTKASIWFDRGLRLQAELTFSLKHTSIARAPRARPT